MKILQLSIPLICTFILVISIMQTASAQISNDSHQLTTFGSESSHVNYFSNSEFQIYKIKEKHYEFFLPYSVSNAEIENMIMDCPSLSMVINIKSVSEDGKLTISIPRSLLDAKLGSMDDFFFVLSNGFEVNYTEIEKNTVARTLHIPLALDTKIIEILATNVGQFPEPYPCGIGNPEKSSYYHLMSPLKQIKSGILAGQVQCKEDLKLVIRYQDGMPLCVKPDHVPKLKLRFHLLIPS